MGTYLINFPGKTPSDKGLSPHWIELSQSQAAGMSGWLNEDTHRRVLKSFLFRLMCSARFVIFLVKSATAGNKMSMQNQSARVAYLQQKNAWFLMTKDLLSIGGRFLCGDADAVKVYMIMLLSMQCMADHALGYPHLTDRS